MGGRTSWEGNAMMQNTFLSNKKKKKSIKHVAQCQAGPKPNGFTLPPQILSDLFCPECFIKCSFMFI